MTSCEFGDVVPFPFTDQSTVKKRPAVVISSETYHRERPDVVFDGCYQPAAWFGRFRQD